MKPNNTGNKGIGKAPGPRPKMAPEHGKLGSPPAQPVKPNAGAPSQNAGK